MKSFLRSPFDFGQSIILSLIHGLLLLPILSLFLQINELTGFESLLLFFIITQFTVSLFKKGWVYFLVQFGLILVFLYQSFPSLTADVSFIGWIGRLWEVILEQSNLISAGSTTEIPLFFAIVALFALISLLSFASIHQRFPFLSFFIAFGYLIILHTFTGYAIMNQTVSVVGFGLLLISLSRLDVTQGKRYFIKLSAFTATLIGLLIGVSYWGLEWFAPSQNWAESATVDYQNTLERRGFFDWIDTASPGSRYRQTGMGTDDTQLGGPLRKDYTRLFQAYMSEPSYWKVLHRWNYTGEGWDSANTGPSEQIFSPYDRTPSFSSFGATEGLYSETLETATLNWQSPVTYIAQPYGWSSLAVDGNLTSYSLTYNHTSDYHAVLDRDETIDRYTIDYAVAFPNQSSEEILRGDDGWRYEFVESVAEYLNEEQIEAENTINEQMVSIPLEEFQLPASFPQRAKDLAQEITEGMESEYEMVRAIESYLKNDGGYRYSLRDTAQTPPGEDYVDHFLFETMVGYCDNFSTAMVTMLRSVGIPARWVKGFTPGSSQTTIDGEDYYQITNANAHSWPEVYFPSVGWVPFEPSPSFANPVTRTANDVSPEDERFSLEDEAITSDALETNTESEDDAPEPEPLEEEEDPEVTDPEADATGSSSTDSSASEILDLSLIGYLAAAIGSIFILLGSIYFSWHLKLMTWLLEKAVQNNKLSLEHASMWTLKLFEQKGKRANSQTIYDYMQSVRSSLGDPSTILLNFSRLIDQTLYGKQSSTKSMNTSEQAILLETLDRLKQWIKLKKA